MLRRLVVRENQTPESARKVLDGQLGVSGWAVPAREARSVPKRDPRAPWWWESAEDASESFLKSMGVNL